MAQKAIQDKRFVDKTRRQGKPVTLVLFSKPDKKKFQFFTQEVAQRELVAVVETCLRKGNNKWPRVVRFRGQFYRLMRGQNNDPHTFTSTLEYEETDVLELNVKGQE